MIRSVCILLISLLSVGCSSSSDSTTGSGGGSGGGGSGGGSGSANLLPEVGNATVNATFIATLGITADANNFASKIDSASDIDVYRFDVTTAGTITFETVTVDTYPINPTIMPEPSGIGPYTLPVPAITDRLPDPQVRLLDSTSAMVALDNDSGAGRESYVTIFLSTPGDYFIEIESADGAIGEYIIDYRWAP